jgi:membrane associated rhomboid family serine protease
MFRQRSGSSLCYACGKLNRVDASVCFYCGRRNPGLWGFGPAIGRLVGGLDFAALVTVIAVAAYVASLALDPRAAFAPRGVFDLLAPGGRALNALGMAGAFPWRAGHWWTVLTAIYLHGSLLHILFNLLWIRQLLPDVEEVYGQARTIVIFTLSGAAGFLLSDAAGNPFTLGASGAIFGVLGAMVWYGRRRGGHFGAAVLRQYGGWALILFVFGLLSGLGVDNWGHAGGFLGGLLVALVLGAGDQRPERGIHRVLAAACLGLTAVAFALQLWTAFIA